MLDVACVGVLCADVLVKPVDRLPDKGKLALVDELTMKVGGCAANAAIDLARMGVSASVITQVGDDGFGRFLSQTLEAEHVDTTGLGLNPSVATSAS
jgi:sugar/nucleoside kinase (ribokinase family)